MTRNTLPESKIPAVPPRILLGPGPSNVKSPSAASDDAANDWLS